MERQMDISVVAPCYNEEPNVREFVRRVSGVLEGLGLQYEIILVDDGSRDGTYEAAVEIARANSAVSVIRFSRNFGHQAAVTAGMDHARGKAVVLIDGDLQDPPEVIGEMVAKWREGYEVVYGQRKTREGETWFKLFTANLFYRLLRFMTDKSIPADTGDFRLMDRVALEAMNRMRERHRFIRGMVSWVGFRQTPVMYDRKARRAGTTKYPFWKMFLFAIDAITSFSVLPLRLITLFGVVTIAAAVVMGLVVLWVRIFMPGYFIPGFPVLTLLLLFFGGAQLFSVGVIGEYLGRIYEEIKGRPLYIVRSIYGGAADAASCRPGAPAVPPA